MTYNITLTANHQSLTAKYLPLAAESVQYLTAKVVYETDDWTGREIKAMFGHGCTVYEVPVIDGEITAKQQLNLTAGDWRVWLVGNSARDGEVIPRITTNIAHIIVAPTGGTEGSPFPTIPPTVEERLRADMGDLADLTTEDKSSLVAAINEVRQTGGGGVQPDWNQNNETAPDYVKNRPFYTGDPVETVLVEESTVSFSESRNGKYRGEFLSTFSATVGETYKVSWDGTVYECTCVTVEGLPAIGNLSIMGPGSDTGEPFIMVVANGRGIYIVTADTSASHTFSICVFAQEVVKIDPKYIRDMYYTGDPVETVLVEESTVSFAENHGLYVAQFPSTFEATVGETYKVYWDGAAYECACVNFNGKTVIGNLSIVGAGSDTGEPFIISIFKVGRIDIATQNTSASHTISISANVAPITKIDEKYLPNTIATKSEVEAAQTTASNAQTTAENAQTAAENARITANIAQNTANTAKTTAENAQTAAENAQTAAENAQTTANTAKTTAENARSTANTAKTAAENAQTAAEKARSTANTAKTEVAKALTVNSSGSIYAPIAAMNGGTYQSLTLTSKDQYHNASFKVTESVGLQIWVGRDHGNQSSPSNPSTVEFKANGTTRMRLKGIDELIMNSSTAGSTKKFRITVDDSGTITATEVS